MYNDDYEDDDADDDDEDDDGDVDDDAWWQGRIQEFLAGGGGAHGGKEIGRGGARPCFSVHFERI